MWRFIIVSFSFLAFAFYQLSGGADYQPREGSRQDVAAKALLVKPVTQTKLAAAPKATQQQADSQAVVTRASLVLEEMPRVTVTKSVTVAPIPSQDAKAVKPAADAYSLANLTTPNLTTAKMVPATQVAQQPAPEPEADPAKDIRQITGIRVNMRMGPGTRYDVVTKLTEGTEVEVLQTPGDGWLKLRVLDTGRVGWMADYLVTAAN